MIRCHRCNDTGIIEVSYYHPIPAAFSVHCEPVKPASVELRTKHIECNKCFGFSAIPVRRRIDDDPDEYYGYPREGLD